MSRGSRAVAGLAVTAAALVAGAAALVLRVNPSLRAKEVRDLLMATSEVRPAGPAAPGSTIKLLDLDEAVKKATV
jgi:hypothetical protein